MTSTSSRRTSKFTTTSNHRRHGDSDPSEREHFEKGYDLGEELAEEDEQHLAAHVE